MPSEVIEILELLIGRQTCRGWYICMLRLGKRHRMAATDDHER